MVKLQNVFVQRANFILPLRSLLKSGHFAIGAFQSSISLQILTKDSVTVFVNAIMYYKVIERKKNTPSNRTRNQNINIALINGETNQFFLINVSNFLMMLIMMMTVIVNITVMTIRGEKSNPCRGKRGRLRCFCETARCNYSQVIIIMIIITNVMMIRMIINSTHFSYTSPVSSAKHNLPW